MGSSALFIFLQWERSIMQFEISGRMSGVHGSAIRELFKLGADPI